MINYEFPFDYSVIILLTYYFINHKKKLLHVFYFSSVQSTAVLASVQKYEYFCTLCLQSEQTGLLVNEVLSKF